MEVIPGLTAHNESAPQVRPSAHDCYLSALKNLAAYVVEVDPGLTATYRKHLGALCEDVSSGRTGALDESRATLRGLLRDYRDKASQFLNKLREELAATACSLEEILGSLADCESGDHACCVRKALAELRAMSDSPPEALREALLSAAETIEYGFDQMRKHHQLTVSQFEAEIRVLHKRIDALETAVAVDNLTKLFNRSEIEERIRAASGPYCLLLIKVSGFRLAETRFEAATAEELIAAFAKRLRNGVPPPAAIGRWAREDFVALVPASKSEVMNMARWVAEHLSGAYACLQNGRTVRPALRIEVAVAESSEAPAQGILARIGEFFEARSAGD